MSSKIYTPPRQAFQGTGSNILGETHEIRHSGQSSARSSSFSSSIGIKESNVYDIDELRKGSHHL